MSSSLNAEPFAPLVEQASQSVDHAMDSLRETSHQLRLKAEHASDSTVNYIRQEPVKAVLMAAAIGAALMTLANLLSHSGERR